MTPPQPSPPPQVELTGLQTETRNPRTTGIDQVSTQELCEILNREDCRVPAAVEPCIPIIAEVIDALADRVRKGGRVIYIGAGTSGRLGVLDASEIPPTYSAPSNQFVALIAGGDYALRHAKEGAEDSRVAAEEDLKALNLKPECDSLVAIASSGRTPYVLGGLSYAKSLGCTTVGLVCVQPSAVVKEGNADYTISTVTGPEVVTGSTRMKAGTATKLVLNMISTGIMIKLGKTYGNLMIDLKATNLKLKQRSRNILRIIAGSTCVESDEELDRRLEACDGSVKLAAVTLVLNVSISEAEKRLEKNKGVLDRVFEEERKNAAQLRSHDEGLILCVDAGGSSCKAVIMAKNGSKGCGTAGPCNVSTVGLDAAISSISKAIQSAINDCEATKGRQLQSIRFSSAWIGMAGYDRPWLPPLINSAISELVNLQIGDQLRVTTDIDLMPLAVASRHDVQSIIVLVAGTGSVAMSYSRSNGKFTRTGRVGGWGHLLGDDGSGYALGREALRKALHSVDFYRICKETGATPDAVPTLSRAILLHFQTQHPSCEPEDLLSSILVPDPSVSKADAALETTTRIAGVAKVVLQMAASDEDATHIVENGAASLAQLIISLVNAQGLDPSKTALVLAGGLMQDELYKSRVLDDVEKSALKFNHVETVSQPAVLGAEFLLQQHAGPDDV